MSWIGLRHKGVEPLFPDEWNAVVDALDILYKYTEQRVTKEDLLNLYSDIIPAQDDTFDLGSSTRAWKDVYAHYGYFLDDAFVQGKRVLKDGDPVRVYEFIEYAKQDIEDIKSRLSAISGALGLLESYIQTIYGYAKPPTSLETASLVVGTTPVPLSDLDLTVKRIHVKVPSWAGYIVYIGSYTRQDFILEPGDKEVFEIVKPKNIYVRSLGNVTIFIAMEI